MRPSPEPIQPTIRNYLTNEQSSQDLMKTLTLTLALLISPMAAIADTPPDYAALFADALRSRADGQCLDGFAVVALVQPGAIDINELPCSADTYNRFAAASSGTVTRVTAKTCLYDAETSYRNLIAALDYIEEIVEDSRKYHRRPGNVASVASVSSRVAPPRRDTPCR
ncbi:hypothetical protein GAY33_10610 [Azospirillum brasilense]|uniref:hypothetical protein n=1 Tax=Azospirillum argentinense TaxID=2970906 RepID=UPI00190D0EED|nr:hypothetical protein [Azospirillum argentinense]MBK3799677.1 hypothetical protein [Azospirillum argentinense]